jgi:hypothetical protein
LRLYTYLLLLLLLLSGLLLHGGVLHRRILQRCHLLLGAQHCRLECATLLFTHVGLGDAVPQLGQHLLHKHL